MGGGLSAFYSGLFPDKVMFKNCILVNFLKKHIISYYKAKWFDYFVKLKILVSCRFDS